MSDIFADASSNSQQTDDNDLSAWIGEGKKYPDAETALKALPHAQRHIAQLEEEASKLRNQVGTLEQRVEEPKPAEDKTSEILDQVKRLAAVKTQPAETQQFDETALVGLVDKHLDQRTAQAAREANRKAAQNALVEVFGDRQKASDALKAKAEELDMTVAQLTELGETSPKALVSYFTKAEANPNTESKPNPTPVNVNQELDSQNLIPGTKRYFDHMRKTDPKRYNSPETLSERMRSLQEKGEDFYK
jgi:chromosome segregation ATPase